MPLGYTALTFFLGTEAWLSRNIMNDQLSIQNNFNIHRTDRSLSRGGGVLVAMKTRFPTTVVDWQADIEIWFVRVKFTFPYILIGVCYKPPDADVVFIQELCKVLNFVTLHCRQCPVFLGSDFIYPRIDWVEFVPDSKCRNISQCRGSIDTCRACSLHQVVLVPTRENSVLDLLFCIDTWPNIIFSCRWGYEWS